MTKQNKEDFTYTLLAPVRMIFANVVEPRAFKAGADPKYSASFLIPDDSNELEPIKAMITRVYQAAFPGRQIEAARVPLKSGDAQADKAREKGKDLEIARGYRVLGASSNYRPVLSVILNKSWVDLTDDELVSKYGNQFYAGVEARAAFFFKAYMITETNWGVTAYLQNVASYNRGTKLGAASGASRFGQVHGHVTEENPEAAAAEWA